MNRFDEIYSARSSWIIMAIIVAFAVALSAFSIEARSDLVIP